MNYEIEKLNLKKKFNGVYECYKIATSTLAAAAAAEHMETKFRYS